jgi:hypothetical protein
MPNDNLINELTTKIANKLTLDNPGSATSFQCGKLTGVALATFKDSKPYVTIFISLNNSITHRHSTPIHEENLNTTQDLKQWVFYNKPKLTELIIKEVLQLYINILPF